MVRVSWSIGCSGFYYPEWKGLFYPDNLAKSKWFEFYCAAFNSLEINGSFYRYPRVTTLESWYKRSPTDFNFSIKVPRFITHYWKFKDVGRKLRDFYTIARDGLREKLGCVLFQLHPKTAFSVEMLDRIVSAVDTRFTNVVEFRHSSWWNTDVFNTFRQEKITFCSISHPELPDNVITATDTTYYRFHGVPKLYSSKYGRPRLTKVHSKLEGTPRSYVYFNNTARGSAIKDAHTFVKLARGRPGGDYLIEQG